MGNAAAIQMMNEIQDEECLACKSGTEHGHNDQYGEYNHNCCTKAAEKARKKVKYNYFNRIYNSRFQKISPNEKQEYIIWLQNKIEYKQEYIIWLQDFWFRNKFKMENQTPPLKIPEEVFIKKRFD